MTAPWAVTLAVLAAACFAVAAGLQHRAVGELAGPRRRRGPTRLGPLLHRPGWLAGLALAAAGAGLHTVALVHAPLSVVQPIGVLAVPFAVLLSAWRTRRPPGPGVVAGVVASVAGVAAFVALTAGGTAGAPVAGGAVAAAGAGGALAVAVLAGIALATRGRVRCLSAAAAAAAAFGLVSALLRAVSQQLATGAVALVSPAVVVTAAGIGLALLAGGWLVQQAFASGPPEVVVACLTVGDPIVAVGIGVLVLGEAGLVGPRTWPLLLACAAVAAAGVLALARHHPDAATSTARPVPAPPTERDLERNPL
ncbi:MAG TPA: hypothetical protein VD813_07185 [Pseudonocardia sp.]|nr:hypothetical protein [Pseudonocardia sp.]